MLFTHTCIAVLLLQEKHPWSPASCSHKITFFSKHLKNALFQERNTVTLKPPLLSIKCYLQIHVHMIYCFKAKHYRSPLSFFTESYYFSVSNSKSVKSVLFWQRNTITQKPPIRMISNFTYKYMCMHQIYCFKATL